MAAELTGTGFSKAEAEFQEKMKERMRQAMGDLMPDEVLAGIVGKGIHEAFFTEKQKPGAYYGSQSSTEPAWVVTFIREECKARVEEEVKKYISQHPRKFAEVIDGVLREGIASAMFNSIASIFQPAMNNLTNQIIEIQNKLLTN